MPWVLGILLLLVVAASVSIPFLRDLKGNGTPGPNTSLQEQQARAEEGDPQAQFALGQAYMEGIGVATDSQVGLAWYRRAAENGHVEAQYRMGMALMEGRGTTQDYLAASTWLERAARNGLPEAMYSLGRLYSFGYGVAENKLNAYIWYNLAAGRGYLTAAQPRDEILRQLPPEEIAAAQAQSREIDQEIPSRPGLVPPPTEGATNPPPVPQETP